MGKGEGEKHQCERETLISCLLYVPQPGTKAATGACALTGNRTNNLLSCGTLPNRATWVRIHVFSCVPCLTQEPQILLAQPSKYIQNSTTTHHLPYYQASRRFYFLLEVLQEPPNWSPAHTLAPRHSSPMVQLNQPMSLLGLKPSNGSQCALGKA